jgi:hypothetical protein
VKIWIGYGSEHSANLKMVGHFRTEEAAKSAEQVFARLTERVYTDTDAGSYDASERPPDLSEEMAELLRELKLYGVGPADIENFAYDHSVERQGVDLVLTTEEDNVGGFVKILVDSGARIEIFSMHTHTPSGEPKSDD